MPFPKIFREIMRFFRCQRTYVSLLFCRKILLKKLFFQLIFLLFLRLLIITEHDYFFDRRTRKESGEHSREGKTIKSTNYKTKSLNIRIQSNRC